MRVADGAGGKGAGHAGAADALPGVGTVQVGQGGPGDEGPAVVGRAVPTAVDRYVQGFHLQGAQVFGDGIVVPVGVAPVDLIGIVAFAGAFLFSGGGDPDGRIQGDRDEMCHGFRQDLGGVAGIPGVHGDPDVGGICHDVPFAVRLDVQAVLQYGHCFGRIQPVHTFLQFLRIPSCVFAGLDQEFGIVGIQAQHVVREILDGERFHGEDNTVAAVLSAETDEQALAGFQFELPVLPGHGVGAVDPDASADADHGLGPEGGAGHDGGVPPFRIFRDISWDGPDAGLLTGQGLAVVDFFRASGPDGQRGGIHAQRTVHRFDVREVAGHIFSGSVVNRVGFDDVGTAARVRAGTNAGDCDGAVSREAGDQRAVRAAEGFAVIQFAGGLGDHLDRVIPGPAAVGGVQVDLAGGQEVRILRRQQELRAVRGGPGHALHEGLIRLDDFLHKTLDVRGGHLSDGEGRTLSARCVLQGGDLAGAEILDTLRALRIGVIQPADTFQDANGGHRIVPGGFRGLDRGEDQGTPDAHGQGRGLDIKGGVLVQLFRNVHKDLPLREVQAHMLPLLDELHAGGFIQGDDLRVVHADGSGGCLPGEEGFAAVEAYVLQDEAGDAGDVQDLYVPVIAQQAHCGGVIALLRRGRSRDEEKHEEKDHAYSG